MAAVGGLYTCDPQYQYLSVQDRVEAAKDELTAITVKSLQAEAPLIQLRDESYKLLMKYCLAEVKWESFNSTGFHPWNRSGAGVSPSNAIDKLVAFFQSGLSETEMLRACAIQRQPGIIGDAHELANSTLVEGCNGQLAPVAQGSLQQFSLTCNHTGQAMRAAMHEVRCDNEIIAPNGHVSKALLEENRPAFAKAFSQGIPWLQLHWIVEQEFAGIIRLILNADNIPNAIAQQDNTATLLMKCHQTAAQLLNDHQFKDHSDGPFWHEVQLRVENSEMTRKADVAHCIAYCKNWSGGLKDPFIIKEIDAYSKSITAIRDLDASLLSNLSKLDLGPARGALWRGACIKLGLTASERPLQKSEINLMTGRGKEFVLQADEFMKLARTLSKDETDKIKVRRALDTMDLCLVRHVLNRARTYANLKEIGHAFYNMMRTHGSAIVCPKEWTCTPKAKAANAKRGILELGIGGPSADAILNALKEKGCDVGSHCVDAKSLPYCVISIEAETIKLRGTLDKIKYGKVFDITVSTSDVLKDFKYFKTVVPEDMLLSILQVRE